MIDAGLRRNRFASHSPSFLSQDGGDPNGRLSRFRYTTLAWYDGTAEQVRGAATLSASYSPTALGGGPSSLFAAGVSDTLPRVKGLAEVWGKRPLTLLL